MTFRSRAIWLGVLTLVALGGLPTVRAHSPAQQAASTIVCSATWLGHESAIEDYLRSANVTKFDVVPIGVTKPQRAQFEPGGPVSSAAWKPLRPSYRGGFRESYKAELAAYALDRLLGMHMVPPVVERKLQSNSGALVYWIDNVHAWDIKKPPTGPEPRWGQQVSRMRLFDQLIANIDRNAGNLLYDDDWHLFLIDHSRAFVDRKDLKGTTEPKRVERAFWDKIEALDMATLQTTLSEWLSEKEIAAILARRDRMREAIKKMVAERGEADVFF
jgi:hypothetical protein